MDSTLASWCSAWDTDSNMALPDKTKWLKIHSTGKSLTIIIYMYKIYGSLVNATISLATTPCQGILLLPHQQVSHSSVQDLCLQYELFAYDSPSHFRGSVYSEIHNVNMSVGNLLLGAMYVHNSYFLSLGPFRYSCYHGIYSRGLDDESSAFACFRLLFKPYTDETIVCTYIMMM